MSIPLLRYNILRDQSLLIIFCTAVLIHIIRDIAIIHALFSIKPRSEIIHHKVDLKEKKAVQPLLNNPKEAH